jgi:DMSO/TMAO reductase YedYZ molybdopterin-dependent catalytic subunit
MDKTRLQFDGHVQRPCEFTFEDLQKLDEQWQVVDVRRFGAKGGDAVRLRGLLENVRPKSDATHIGLHGSRDDFHASIPLDPIRDKALVIYQLDGQPLAPSAGGPFRFFVPDHAACHTDEIDECANVKYLDRIELTVGRGFDNRPEDDEEHARLHSNE